MRILELANNSYVGVDEDISSAVKTTNYNSARKTNKKQPSSTIATTTRGRKVNLIRRIYTRSYEIMRDIDDIEIAIKVVIVGNGGVGKSSLIQRYCKGIFTKDYKKTIGVDFLERQIEIDGEDVRIMLWDTAGQEEFDAITKAYYRGAQACVLTFSTTDRASFEAIGDWKRKVENECQEIPTVIVQNKIDLIENAVVSTEEVENLARQLGCRLIRTSVKEDVNVVSVFRYLATKCHQLMTSSLNEESSMYAGGGGAGGNCNINHGGNTTCNSGLSISGHRLQPTISAFSPTFTKSTNNNGTIILRPAKKNTSRKRKILLKKCRIV